MTRYSDDNCSKSLGAQIIAFVNIHVIAGKTEGRKISPSELQVVGKPSVLFHFALRTYSRSNWFDWITFQSTRIFMYSQGRSRLLEGGTSAITALVTQDDAMDSHLEIHNYP